MAKDIAKPDDVIEIKFPNGEESLMIRRALLEKVTNRAGVEMWKYPYWEIYADKKYKISEESDYQRVVKALNSTNVMFIAVNGWLISKRDIHKVSPQQTGYKRVEQ